MSHPRDRHFDTNLTVFFVAELPWMRANEDDPQFAAWQAWAENRTETPPPADVWRKLDPGALALMRRALLPDPTRRLTLQAMIDHSWFTDKEDEHVRPRG